MPAVNYNFIIEQGSDFTLTFRYNDTNNNPVDLSNKCVVLQWITDDGAIKQIFSSGANSNYDTNDWSIVGDNRGVIRFKIAANLTKTFKPYWRTFLGSHLLLAAKTSPGWPKINLGKIHCGLRIEMWTTLLTRAASTAISQAELPAPIIKTLLSRQDSSTPLNSCECKNLPLY